MIICVSRIKLLTLQSQNQKGSLAEWLGAGLQNRLRRFESARNLCTHLSQLIKFSWDLLFHR